MQLEFFDGSQVNLFIAFAAGFITFFASCLLPLVPTYLAYLSGISLSGEENTQDRWKIFKVGFLFVIGFIATFILLGLAFNQLAGTVVLYKAIIEKMAGLLFIFLGLFMMGVFKNRFLSQERKLDLHFKFQQHQSLQAILTGVAFGVGWTPCIGPVLAVILFWASQAETAFQGMLLLFAYGVGLGVPFLIIALGFEKIIPVLKKYTKISQVVSFISGLFVLLTGVLIFFAQFKNWGLIVIKALNLSSLSI